MTASQRAETRSLTALAALGVAGVALLAAACGSSPRGHVAQLGSTLAPTGASSSPAGASQHSLLAFAACMRSEGVPDFPDPDGSGALPKRRVAQLAVDSPGFVPAHRACAHLLPNGGQPSQALVQQAWNDMRSFARCMRSRDVRNWPDPTVTSAQDNRPFFDTPKSIDPNAPRITTAIQACRHVLHADNPLVTTQ